MDSSILYSNILESMDNGVITFDRAGKVITFNGAASKILGIQIENALNRLNSELFFGNEKNDEFNDILITVICEQKTFFYKEVSFWRDDKSVVSLGVTSSLLKDEHGNLYGSVLVLSDLTERKKAMFLENTLSRYISREVVNLILRKPEDLILDGEEKDITILFTDIRNFTSMSENMNPKDIVTILRDYFEAMVKVIFKYNGTLDKFIGDAMMCVYGAPVDQSNHAENAILSALEIKKELKKFNNSRINSGLSEIKIGIGINSGTAITGNVGSKERLEYTAIGDSVNTASRLESTNKIYGTTIIVSENTHDRVKGKFISREIDVVNLKGKEIPVKIFEIINTIKDATNEEKELISIYNEALRLFHNKKFKNAKNEFDKVLKIKTDDLVSIMYMKKCLEEG